jgi:hypothetical protein
MYSRQRILFSEGLDQGNNGTWEPRKGSRRALDVRRRLGKGLHKKYWSWLESLMGLQISTEMLIKAASGLRAEFYLL